MDYSTSLTATISTVVDALPFQGTKGFTQAILSESMHDFCQNGKHGTEAKIGSDKIKGDNPKKTSKEKQRYSFESPRTSFSSSSCSSSVSLADCIRESQVDRPSSSRTVFCETPRKEISKFEVEKKGHMERSSMWRACASKRAFRIGVLCAILTPVAKVMVKRLKHTQNDPNKEHVTINSRLCADLPTHGASKMSNDARMVLSLLHQWTLLGSLTTGGGHKMYIKELTAPSMINAEAKELLYGETDKRLAELEFMKPKKDLGALKKILEAMQKSKQMSAYISSIQNPAARLVEGDPKAEPPRFAPEQPNPVSVLDATFIGDESHSSVKKKSKAFEGKDRVSFIR
ncbi:hypothetical protein F3Y22_tig00117017pilonHSYRG00294 [Hibiscus syriacus]|uniref:Uncharacterized protein n=1 Tax=Hibiscus syriacus TaxID=106335 RepID=A0A6A2WEK5_HIBSY|nr:hypothetical protein F3Y22_tig00117017pilonHSYRG00294 [Hibiscus syriacus]